MLTYEHKNVLLKVMEKIRHSEVTWALTGSASFAVQRMPVDVHDIDIQTDEKGAYAIGSALAQFIIKPVCFSSTQNIRSHFGHFVMDGIDIEVMGDIQKYYNDQWEHVVSLPPLIRHFPFEGLLIPVMDLHYVCAAYSKMGRLERVRQLVYYFRNRPFPY